MWVGFSSDVQKEAIKNLPIPAAFNFLGKFFSDEFDFRHRFFGYRISAGALSQVI